MGRACEFIESPSSKQEVKNNAKSKAIRDKSYYMLKDHSLDYIRIELSDLYCYKV